MLFGVDADVGAVDPIPAEQFADLDIWERRDLQEWAIEEPRILGEDLLVVTSEYANFEDTRERLDLLAVDSDGKLVVIELKRDRADRTTDLQAIKYASYCATLTAADVQKDYRSFWNNREGAELTPEEVGRRFVDFLERSDEEIQLMGEGWADFDLDDKPRIVLVAGEFGIEVTAPVTWLSDEFGMDVTCTKIEAYQHEGRVLLNSQQVIPVPEAEEYRTKRREKQEQQESHSRRSWSLPVLLDRGVLSPGDEVHFDPEQVPGEADRPFDPDDTFWWASITGDTGQSNNVRWHHDDEVYSFTGLSKELLHRLVGRDTGRSLNGYDYWCHPAFDDRTLTELRESDARADDRGRERAGRPDRE